MKLGELRELLADRQDVPDDWEVKIEVFKKGAVGRTPSVGVTSMSMGFDWDSGTLLIHPENKLVTAKESNQKAWMLRHKGKRK